MYLVQREKYFWVKPVRLHLTVWLQNNAVCKISLKNLRIKVYRQLIRSTAAAQGYYQRSENNKNLWLLSGNLNELKKKKVGSFELSDKLIIILLKYLRREMNRTFWHLNGQTTTAIFSWGAHKSGSVITGLVEEWGEAVDGFDETVCSLKRTGINHQSAATPESGSSWSSARHWGVQALIRKIPDDGSGGGLLRHCFINCWLFTCQSSYQLISRAGTIWIMRFRMTTHSSRRIGHFFTSKSWFRGCGHFVLQRKTK